MLFRLVAFAIFLVALGGVRAQVALPSRDGQLLKPSQSAAAAPDSAWLDLRQNSPTHSKIQAAPSWVESISFVPAKADTPGQTKSVFRIRLTRPNDECQLLLFRLYFDDQPDQQPELIAWDESGTQLL